MPENGTHKCTNAVNIVQPIRNSSHMAKILSVYNILQARDYENGNGGKRRVSRLTKFIHATICDLYSVDYDVKFNMNLFSLGLCFVCVHLKRCVDKLSKSTYPSLAPITVFVISGLQSVIY